MAEVELGIDHQKYSQPKKTTYCFNILEGSWGVYFFFP